MGGGPSKLKHIKQDNPTKFWKIEEDLGAGSYGKVHRVRNRESGISAAAKVAPISKVEDLKEFAIEVGILAANRHDNISNFIDGFYHDGNLWILIDVCEAGSLNDILRKDRTGFEEKQIACVAQQVLTGLEFLHSRWVIHRDLNASNILMTNDGVIKIGDFGVSAKNTKPDQKRYTFIGTPNWMAPEVVACENQKPKPYSYPVDIWSLGITVIELGDVYEPWHDLHAMKVLLRIASAAPPCFAKPEKWSSPIKAFLSRCLTKDASQRPSATTLLSDPFIQTGRDRTVLLPLAQKVTRGASLQQQTEPVSAPPKPPYPSQPFTLD